MLLCLMALLLFSWDALVVRTSHALQFPKAFSPVSHERLTGDPAGRIADVERHRNCRVASGSDQPASVSRLSP